MTKVMASHPRYMVLSDKSYFHATWKCHGEHFLLKKRWAKNKYLALLQKYKDKYQIKLLNLCVMSNHFHLVGYVEMKENLSRFFKVVNSQFALFYNRQMGRTSQVVKDRFHCGIIENQADLLKVMFYVDLNPKRAKMVGHPREYDFSSYRHYAEGIKSPLIDEEPECYKNLGVTPEERQAEYRKMVEYILENDWKDKKNYSQARFIGNPDWVTQRYVELKMELKKWRKLSQVSGTVETPETG